jgi:hypothetical protein
MKKIKNLVTIFILLTSLSFVSCEDESIDPSLINNPGNNSGGTIDGDYWPAAFNNSWAYSNNGGANQTMKMIGTSTVNNNSYYDFDSVFGQGIQVNGTAAMKMRKNSGNYFVRIEGITLNLGGGITATQTPFEFLVLKDNIPVNQTWNGTYTQTTSYSGSQIPLPSVTTTSTYIGTILGTNLTETVSGETFNNVIKLKISQTILLTTSPTPTQVETTYWFAKNVGPIKSETLSNGTTTTSILTDYVLN